MAESIITKTQEENYSFKENDLLRTEFSEFNHFETLKSVDEVNIDVFRQPSLSEGFTPKKNLLYQDVILNEKWQKTLKIPSIIVSHDKDLVICECAINIEEEIFETRVFPRIVFENLPNLENRIPVMISLNSKPGTIQIKVFPGEGLFEKSIFSINSVNEELKSVFNPKPFKFEND